MLKQLSPYFFTLYIFSLFACGDGNPKESKQLDSKKQGLELIVLGNVQDAGKPHIGCKKNCCKNLSAEVKEKLKVCSLGIIDHDNEKSYLLDASPDISSQIEILNTRAGFPADKMPDAVFLTHAHIGHYTGLMYFGREAKGAKGVKVYAMPKMTDFLRNNGPWQQLIQLNNIQLQALSNLDSIQLENNLQIIPIQVPHRDEYSETVGFKLLSANNSFLFIPDINKWDLWERDIIQEIEQVDLAFLDATFYDGAELNNRDMSEIPHPFVVESMQLFQDLSKLDKSKIHFIHLNHTNPLLDKKSSQYKELHAQGFELAELGDFFPL